MDERQMSAASAARPSAARMIALALVALGGSYAGAFLTSEILTRLSDAAALPASLAPLFDLNGPPSPAWPMATAAGGMCIGLLAVALAALVPGRRRAKPVARARGLAPVPIDTTVAPAESLAWLHVVSGPSARRAGHAAADIAAQWIARGERVLLIDGGPRLRLHGPLVAEPALGLSECLGDRMPLLGVVQCVGVPGCYLLVHGAPIPFRDWAGLGRLVDDARPHFDRVLLALDIGAPWDIGRALAGRYVEAWWSEPDPERGAAPQSLSERIGIRMRGMELGLESKPMLEVLRERIQSTGAGVNPAAEPLAVGHDRPAPEPLPAIRREPLVLDCDLQVKERLRFLMWMRRLQREDRSGSARARAGATAVPQTVISG
jgi:hypothetical protein